jgi:hypothetical protein
VAQIPISFSALAASYPDHRKWSTKQLLDEIGGTVRSTLNDGINTCALRMSYALNHAGAPLHWVPGVHFLQGAPGRPTTGPAHSPTRSDLYVFRVQDMRSYLSRQYGQPPLIYDGRTPDKFRVQFSRTTQGIIAFIWEGRWADFNASGHVDLFQVRYVAGQPPVLTAGCVGACYFNPGPMKAYLWEMRL